MAATSSATKRRSRRSIKLSEKVREMIETAPEGDQLSLADTASTGTLEDLAEQQQETLGSKEKKTSCDACPYCPDTCGNDQCNLCAQKEKAEKCCPPCGELTYTSCQVRRHNSRDSCWLVCGNVIYDATPFVERHPGGSECILRKAGGVQDCSVDFSFHSKGAQARWKKAKVGLVKVCNCGSDDNQDGENDRKWWMLWSR